MTTSDEIVRTTANQLAKLFIARRDVKAFASRDEWFPERSAMTVDDFKSHLQGKRCMGTYLLNRKNQVKFFAFDIDLMDRGPYFIIRDLEELEDMEDEYAAAEVGETDLDLKFGNWEEALHDPDHDGYRWVRSYLRFVVDLVCESVEKVLGLQPFPVITGGGAHVLIPLGELTQASEARAAAHAVMESVTPFWRTSENFYSNSAPETPRVKGRFEGETVNIEVFPKQDGLPDADSLGNLLRLPFGWHSKAKIRTYVLDRTPEAQVPPWTLPKLPGAVALDRAMDSLGLRVSSGD